MTYADHAFEYFKKGYAPLPLPAREKKHPPKGYTGDLGYWPSGADIQEWIETNPDGNIALRLPRNVICLDVDAYKNPAKKTMMDAMEDLQSPLPVIGRSTARHDDPDSGHRLYRLPDDKAGTKFISNLDAAGYGPGVDIVQYGYRYIVAPSSIHPDIGTAYAWYDAQGQLAEFPAVDELPFLPDPWIEKLTKRSVERRATEGKSTAYDEMSPARRADIDALLGRIFAKSFAELEEMKSWPLGYRGKIVQDGQEREIGWQENVLRITYHLAALVKADWNSLDPNEFAKELAPHLPHDSGFRIEEGLSQYFRGLDKVEPAEEPYDKNAWFDEVEVRTITPKEAEVIDSPETWPKRPLTGLGNNERALEGVAGKIIYVDDGPRSRWLQYRDGIWVGGSSKDTDDVAATWIDRAWKLALEHEAEKYDDTDEVDSKGKVKEGSSPRAKFRHWMGDQFTSGKKKSAAVQLRQNAEDYSLEVDALRLDSEPYDLAVRNGVVDLRTGQLRDARPLDFITKKSPVVYDPDAKAPTFERYLETSMPHKEIRDYLHKIIGYSLTNSTREEVFFIHNGPSSSNGKSVLMNTMEKILGDHFSPASSKALLTSKNDKVGQDTIDLAGPRFLALSETKQGDSLDEPTIKSLTSGDWRADRAHYSGNEKYRVTGKMHIFTNELPHVNPDDAIRRRLNLVPWEVSFADGRGDPMLEDKLAKELPGILAWAVRGAIAWYAEFEATGKGLTKPQRAIDLENEYFNDEDEVGRWYSARAGLRDVDSDRATWVSGDDLYDDYARWAEGRRSKPMQQTTFLKRLGRLTQLKSERGPRNANGNQPRVWPLTIQARANGFV